MSGRVAVVSGVGPGLGRAVAVGAASAGASVVLVARNEGRLADIAAEITDMGRDALVVAGDITDEAFCSRVATQAHDRFGRVDALVNNAFVQPRFARLEDESLAAIRAGFEINLLAHLSLSRALAPMLSEHHAGSVVMTNSSILRAPREFFGAYKMAKHALLGLARALAEEWGPRGIRVNTVAPGYIYDEPVKAYFEMLAAERGCPPAEVEAEITARHPLGRIPTPAEIAEVIVFLASEQARAVTGQCLDVNGGEFMV